MAALGSFVAGQVLTAAELNAIGDFTTYTPTFTGLTVGDGTLFAAYAPVNELVFLQVAITFGSTTAISGSLTCSYPFTADDTFRDGTGGQCTFRDDDTATNYFGVPTPSSGTIFNIRALDASGTYVKHTNISGTIPFTWATSDRLVVSHWFRPG
ncbi:MAG: hypothetical protein ACO4AY_12845 [Ilumatobacteraceae bacterium]